MKTVEFTAMKDGSRAVFAPKAHAPEVVRKGVVRGPPVLSVIPASDRCPG